MTLLSSHTYIRGKVGFNVFVKKKKNKLPHIDGGARGTTNPALNSLPTELIGDSEGSTTVQ